MQADLEEQFVNEWESASAPPDLIAFLSTHQCRDKQTILALVEIDLEFRLATKQPMPIADYVQRLFELTGNSEDSLALAVRNYQQRIENGEQVEVDAYASQFGSLQHSLRSMLQRCQDLQLGTRVLDPDKTQSHFNTELVREEKIGRYRLIKLLGKGAFGEVYLAFDPELKRKVAIKTPNALRFTASEDAEEYLREARTVALLDHPHIVAIYDVGTTSEGHVYTVSKFIAGSTLKQIMEAGRVNLGQLVFWLQSILQALEHAHRQHIIHRDVKPANILIEEPAGKAYLADFGLALHDDDLLRLASTAGTPAYMSPEQVRGEGHLLDARSDLFALGVVMYELLTGRRPFQGSTANELMHQVLSQEPVPPTDLNSEVPRELERICLKALSKRAAERYASALEMCKDLEIWDQAGGTQQSRLIVPRGLRAFGSDDSDFFLELLPGPRSRQGIPESIQFWKNRIEERDPEQTFRIGLLFGPSGCGKSSLIRAGLLPVLPPSIRAIYVEATAEDTENRLRRGVEKWLPDLADGLSLGEAFAQLRKSSTGTKHLIVIDQLEQWLQANETQPDIELIRALRQADGGNLQVLLSVRDDFGMAATRLMQELGMPILQAVNFDTVDLFDVQHATKVFIKYGQAYGKLPADDSQIAEPQMEFIRSVVQGLAHDGRVVSVHLSLFAEMVKSKPWEPQTLDQVGGTQGIGVNFLEESLGPRSSHPVHRMHRDAARNVLQALLPDLGSDIKGHMQSYQQLKMVAGYEQNEPQFRELLRILDGDLRLITPTEPEGLRSSSNSQRDFHHFQLTHDYLVQPLRIWLTQKKMETLRGRVSLRLAERASLWQTYREQRFLPSFVEYISFLTLAERAGMDAKLNEAARQMMHKAGRLYGLGTLACLLLICGGWWLVAGMFKDNHVKALVENGVATSSLDELPRVLESLEPFSARANPLLLQMFESSSDKQVRAKAALALFDSQPSKVLSELTDWLVTAGDPAQIEVSLRFMLQGQQRKETQTALDELQMELWNIAKDSSQAADRRFRAACVLAQLAPKNSDWTRLSPFVALRLISEQPSRVLTWARQLHAIKQQLLPPLVDSVVDEELTPLQNQMALESIVEVLARDDADILLSLWLTARVEQLQFLTEHIVRNRTATVEAAAKFIDSIGESGLDVSDNPKGLKELARAYSLAAHLEPDRFDWNQLRASHNNSLRSRLIHGFAQAGVTSDNLKARYTAESEASVRMAILMALGQYEEQALEAEVDRRFTDQLLADLRYEKDPGLHAACMWLLTRWGLGEQVREIHASLATTEESLNGRLRGNAQTSRGWFVSSQGMPFIFFRHQLDAEPTQAETTATRYVALAATEVSRRQWLKFSSSVAGVVPGDAPGLDERLPSLDCPMAGITWFEAAHYCNWLSQEDGIPEDQWCYLPNEDGDFAAGMRVKPNFEQLTGYRLPRVAEWTAACRGATSTKWPFGSESEWLPFFAWTSLTSEGHAWEPGLLQPNVWGFFDLLGNAVEWCHDIEGSPGLPEQSSVSIVTSDQRRAMRGGAYNSPVQEIHPLFPFNTIVPTRNTSVGMRPARTLYGIPAD